MTQRVVIVAPGRGTYNKAELGYLKARHADKVELLDAFDAYRTAQGQETLSALDGATRFSGARHTRGDNASAVIYACALFDFLSLDRGRFDIVGITGNSMGWYIALACAGVLDPMGGLRVVNTMGTLMQDSLIGGQLIYPFVDADWRAIPGARDRILAKADDIAGRKDHALALSIDLGGMLVLGGNAAGLDAFEAEMPRLQDRFPLRLPNHAAFHTALQAPIAAEGRARLGRELFHQPQLPLIDGRGAIWQPKASDLSALYAYTLGHQVVAPYDFTAAIRTAARELMPDLFVILGPGTTLGGATAQALTLCGWRGVTTKDALQKPRPDGPLVLSLGAPEHGAA